MQPIGILGGTFDPVHLGHVAIARAVRAALSLPLVLLLPSGQPPHKREQNMAGAQHRLRMAELATQGVEGLAASDMEIRRPGTTYTVDTLLQIAAERPDWRVHYIVGSDTLLDILSWREVAHALRLCTLVAVMRPGQTSPEVQRQCAYLYERFGARPILLPIDGPDISSRQVRALAASGGSLRGLVPPAVEQYIAAHGLYQEDSCRATI